MGQTEVVPAGGGGGGVAVPRRNWNLRNDGSGVFIV